MRESPYHGLNFCIGTVGEMLDDPREEIDSFWVVNTQLGYGWGEDRNVRLFGFINNLLDADDPTLIEAGATSADDSANVVHPRTFGVGLEVYF